MHDILGNIFNHAGHCTGILCWRIEQIKERKIRFDGYRTQQTEQYHTPKRIGNGLGHYFQDKPQYDVKELILTGIAVELPTEHEHWKIIHHFRWAAYPGHFGTESIQLWPAYRSTEGWWGKASDCTGRVLYDKNGATYTAPYISLGNETYTKNSIFWGESTSTDIFAEFSLPNDGADQRGYIAYTIMEKMDGAIVDAWINYTHQQSWAQYPALTAKQQRMANSWNEAGAFKTIQDALQFYPKDDDLRMIGSEYDD